MSLLKKIKIKNWTLPTWISTLFCMIMIFGITSFIFMTILPILGKTLSDIASLDLHSAAGSVSVYLQEANAWAIEHISGLEPDFKIQNFILNGLQDLINIDLLTSVTGSLANFLMNFGIGLFCVVFISFFLIKDGDLLANLITSVVPDKLEQKAKEAIQDIEYLLSRYFGGILGEVLSITLLNSIGLHFIAGLDTDTSITIAAITGIFNIIPYIGPLAGGVLGTIIGLISKTIYNAEALAGTSFLGFMLLLITIFVVTHLIDVFFFQPFIYSSSIKANALEIFIVILLAGTIGGPIGMLVAVPTYTVIRVIAIKFFGDKKAIKVLMK